MLCERGWGGKADTTNCKIDAMARKPLATDAKIEALMKMVAELAAEKKKGGERTTPSPRKFSSVNRKDDAGWGGAG